MPGGLGGGLEPLLPEPETFLRVGLGTSRSDWKLTVFGLAALNTKPIGWVMAEL